MDHQPEGANRSTQFSSGSRLSTLDSRLSALGSRLWSFLVVGVSVDSQHSQPAGAGTGLLLVVGIEVVVVRA